LACRAAQGSGRHLDVEEAVQEVPVVADMRAASGCAVLEIEQGRR
jgi:hypothetical protein